MTLDEWRSVIDVNLSGVFYCCKFGLEILRDGGAIVIAGQPGGQDGVPRPGELRGRQGGRAGTDAGPGRECARRSIRVNAVAPGVIETPMVAHDHRAGRGPTGEIDRPAAARTPEEVAEAVLFLCSPLARYITGHVLEVERRLPGLSGSPLSAEIAARSPADRVQRRRALQSRMARSHLDRRADRMDGAFAMARIGPRHEPGKRSDHEIAAAELAVPRRSRRQVSPSPARVRSRPAAPRSGETYDLVDGHELRRRREPPPADPAGRADDGGPAPATARG